mmetsp:Transcript_25005/g.85568  ORF Transcript_25005/g.85568 Transcript_25005/m.85568 type:complete len:200 (-) Transcript_25005:6964-7563(-)
MPVVHEVIHKVGQASGFNRGHKQVIERFATRVSKTWNLVIPGNHHNIFLIHVVVENETCVREKHILPLCLPPGTELSPVVNHLVHKHCSTQGPHTSKHKLVFKQLVIRCWSPTHFLRGNNTFHYLAYAACNIDRQDRNNSAKVAPAVFYTLCNILTKHLHQEWPILLCFPLTYPTVNCWTKTNVFLVQINHTSSCNCRR